MKKSLFIFAFAILSFSANAQNTTKTQKIKQLLELTGSAKMGIQMMNQLMSGFKNSYSKVNEQFWEDFQKEIKADELENMIIPIYDKYYTESDIDQLIVFYQSPIGKKMIATMPMAMSESIAAGQNWGREIAQKIAAKLKTQGYLEK